MKVNNVATIVHPEYAKKADDWSKWRLTYKGGDDFVDEYLKKFSNREDNTEYQDRKEMTAIPAFAKAAVNDVKNAIFQRADDIVRKEGAKTYQLSIDGQLNGVDLLGSTMNIYTGQEVLPELLSMGKVGVYIDMDKDIGRTQAEKGYKHPYLYRYITEDIRSWNYDGVILTDLLLRMNSYDVDEITNLPTGYMHGYRLFNLKEGKVKVTNYDANGKEVDTTDLLLPMIPFIIFELTDSLLTDIASYQIAMLNMSSSDTNYVTKSNFPFYTEQFDQRAEAQRRTRSAKDTTSDTPVDGTAEEAKIAKDDSIKVGVTQGRRYPINTERPGFIHPSAEPITASMKKQEAMKEDIRQLINLSLANIRPRIASAESRSADNEGLEGGLANIGQELERGEREIAKVWNQYEGYKGETEIIYPMNYNLRTEEQRLNEADKKVDLMVKVPSETYQKEMAKDVVQVTMSHKVDIQKLEKMRTEIDKANVMNLDQEQLNQDIENGLVSSEYASKEIRGYPDGQVEKAKQDHIEKVERILMSQTKMSNKIGSDTTVDAENFNAGARGASDLDPDNKSAKNEKRFSQSKTFNNKKKVRGKQNG